MDTSRKRIGDRQRPPRDGLNGRDGRDGSPGRKGDKGESGERGTDGMHGRDVSLVRALASFTRDPDTRLTQRIDVADESGIALLSIVPLRDADDLMYAAQIIPA